MKAKWLQTKDSKKTIYITTNKLFNGLWTNVTQIDIYNHFRQMNQNLSLKNVQSEQVLCPHNTHDRTSPLAIQISFLQPDCNDGMDDSSYHILSSNFSCFLFFNMFLYCFSLLIQIVDLIKRHIPRTMACTIADNSSANDIVKIPQWSIDEFGLIWTCNPMERKK